jgi:ATP-dependent helicase IRC3
LTRLAPAKWTTVKADLDLSTVEVSSTGDYSTNSLAAHLDTPLVNQLIVRTYLHLASERRSTLVFCVNLTHVDNLVSEFRQAGVDARSVSSTSKPKDRRETLEKFMEGGFPVLVNCEVLTEGTDIPVIDCVITARPTRSINLLAQMVGRGLRLSPETGKTDCHVIDIADNLSRGLTITPTLLGLSSDEVDEVSVDEVSEQKDRPGESELPAARGTQ